MKNLTLIGFVFLFLLTNVFCVNDLDYYEIIENDFIEEKDNPVTDSVYSEKVRERFEEKNMIIEQKKEIIRERVEKGLENSELSDEEKQKIREKIMQRETELEQKMIQNKEMILARINAQQAKQLTQEEKKQIFQERNQLRIQERMEERECPDECFCAGVTVRCWNQDGMEMTITAGDSGNVIVITKNSNMSTNVTLYHHDGRVFANYNGNRTVILNYLPEDIEEKVRERVNARIQERKIELDEEDGNYTVDIQKRVRFLGLIPMKEKMEMRFNPETGELIKTKTKWWGFLARDVRE